MRIGFIGLGKLGLPCALAAEQRGGHEVLGYDISPAVAEIVNTRKIPYKEEGAQQALCASKIRLASIEELVRHSELVFIAVQTPHHPMFEGTTRLPTDRVDFDYSYLVSACRMLNDAIERQGSDKAVAVISTVLPGTMDRYVRPLIGQHFKLCYNPLFIAMGTTMKDFLDPEFVLFGVDDEDPSRTAHDFYRTLHNAPFFKTTIKNAELIKVAYNTLIGTKIVFANTLMEICHKTGADVDTVTDALKLAKARLISSRYLSGGMGDGGGCHPRDNIALSWLARQLDLSYDIFEAIMTARERQTEWLADVIEEYSSGRLPLVILGKTFKAETNLTVGSPSILLKNILEERGHQVEMYDPYVDECPFPYARQSEQPRLFFIGTRHSEFARYSFPHGSVVIDPWRFIPDQEGVSIIRIGEGRR